MDVGTWYRSGRIMSTRMHVDASVSVCDFVHLFEQSSIRQAEEYRLLRVYSASRA